MTFLLLLSALSLSSIAAWYAIAGLMAIFAAMPVPIMIMGGALEAAKLVVASWIYNNWNRIPVLMKTYFTGALIVLMLLTSMGIFGFLSKAHLDQTLSTGDNGLQIQLIDQKIAREQRKIDDANKQLAILDDVVQTLIDNDRISGNRGAVAVKKTQEEDRASLNTQLDTASNTIATLQQEKLVLDKQSLELEAEVGPVKYIAALIYGEEQSKSMLEEAVRWVILMIVFVFDPLAVLMVMAASREIASKRKVTETVTKREPEPEVDMRKVEPSVSHYETPQQPQSYTIEVSDEITPEDSQTLNKTEESEEDPSTAKNRKVGRYLSEVEKQKTNKTRSFLKKVDGKVPNSEIDEEDPFPFEK